MLVALFVLALASGATATVAGFGIGSILTPVLALRIGTPLAVAAVALPHALAATLRLALLWREVDWAVLKRFGIASAVGSLVGALLAFDLSPRAFVATGTAAAVLVDLARTPVYLWRAGGELGELLPTIAVMAVGVLLGTLSGERFLRRLPKKAFRKVVAIAVGLAGVWLIVSEI
ncbi:MAG: TSUP family transporter [Gemmatimonadaceae bacterium]